MKHHTKNTVSVAMHCNKCGKSTQHRVDGGRVGPCLNCIAKLDEKAATKKPEPAAVQGGLFS